MNNNSTDLLANFGDNIEFMEQIDDVNFMIGVRSNQYVEITNIFIKMDSINLIT